MATKLMQLKEDAEGNQTAAYSEYDDAGHRVVDLNNPVAEKQDIEELFKSLAPSIVTDADEDPDTARFINDLDETFDADPDNPVAQSSDDYVQAEMKKYQDSKPKSKPHTVKGKAKH